MPASVHPVLRVRGRYGAVAVLHKEASPVVALPAPVALPALALQQLPAPRPHGPLRYTLVYNQYTAIL